jgi:RHS repeat-associated protein
VGARRGADPAGQPGHDHRPTAATPIQVARGNPVTDADGTRQATLFFRQGTHATLTLPDGSTRSPTTLHVRETEYTVGATGPEAMPGDLPPTSGYTYAAEFSADEAVAAGATGVTFDQPVIDYTENFLNFPVGSGVPAGFYDRTTGQWIGVRNGRVVKVLSVTGGLADLDVDGSGQTASTAALAALGIGDAERQQLAALYQSGQSLWRVPLTHFSPWDQNWPYGPPADAVVATQAPGGGQGNDNCNCTSAASVVRIQNRTLGEDVAVAGTPFTLHYQSDRVPGSPTNSLTIPLSGADVPADLKRIELEVQVAGQRFTATFSGAPNQSTTYTWDGKDAFGRLVQGEQPATVQIGYVYAGVYESADEIAAIMFGLSSGTGLDINRTRKEVTLWSQWQTTVGTWQVQADGLGGWTLDVHDAYQPTTGTLYLGDGSRRSARTPGLDVITTVAGNGDPSSSGDGGPATQAGAGHPEHVAVGPDGSLYFAETLENRVRKVDPRGIITTVAGNGVAGYAGDGGPATQAELYRPGGIALGRDGSLYIADWGNDRVRKVDPNGVITTVAGTGQEGLGADNRPATQSQLNGPADVALGPDGSLYIVESSNDRVRRVGPDGIVMTVAGTGGAGFSGDGGPATKAELWQPEGVTVGPDGSLYIADYYNNRVRKVDPSGIITTVAGTGAWGFGGDGGPATQAQLKGPEGVAVGPDGSVYIADVYDDHVRKVDATGIISSLAGGGSYGYGSKLGDDGPATEAELHEPSGLALGPDGNLYIADYYNYRIRRVAPALPGLGLGSYLVPSADGREVYHFNAAGKHLRTLDALTGAVLYQFSYDGDGRLAAVTDGDGNRTVVVRDAGGNPTALVAPGGQRTALTTNADGYLASISDPTGATVQFGYCSCGRLTSLTDARGGVSRMYYDGVGRLFKDQDAAGGIKLFVQTDQSDGYVVTVTTTTGLSSSYEVVNLPGGGERHTETGPDGLHTVLVLGADGSRTTTFPDGTVQTVQYGPDPRYGMLAPVVKSLTVAPPGSPTYTLAETRSAALSDAHNPLSLTSLTDTVTVNGNAFTTTYDSAAHTLTRTTPLGLQSVVTLDARAHVVADQEPGQAVVQYAYDTRGRLRTVTQGTRKATLDYDDGNNLTAVTDPLSRTVRFAYDPAGRVTQETLPDGQVAQAGYNASGNPTSITPPGRPAHTFAYTATDLLQQYTPPAVSSTGPTQYSHDLDGRLTQEALPGGVTVGLGYDSAGRLGTVTDPTGTETLAYDPTTGLLQTLTAPDGGTLAYGYAGGLLTDVTWAGTVAGTVHRAFDSNFRLSGESIDGGPTVAFSYNNDGALTGAGDATLSYDPQSGRLAGTTLGNVSDKYTYDSFGQVTGYQATAAGAGLLTEGYTPDGAGRIAEKTETVGGTRHVFDYTYDLQGRLTGVREDDATVATYTYDLNGNRLSFTGTAGTVTGTYDAQDRLLSYGTQTYTHTAYGDLRSKTDTATGRTTTYDYDALGNLRSVILSDGTRIDYVIDGQNRRIGKKVNGTLVQGFLYVGSRVVAELDGAGNVVSRFVYSPGGTVPLYLIKGGVTYRFVTDQLGSPRLVVNAANGAVMQRLDYDAFGNVIQDTNPGFQPFGFAGGLYDRDTRLVRFGARDYDAQTGRWTAKDPVRFVGGDTNLYAYVRNDPIKFLDPSGLFLELYYDQSTGSIWGFQGAEGQTQRVLYWPGEGVAGNGDGHGYSGWGPGRNNPNAEKAENVGPIPVGTYTVSGQYEAFTTESGSTVSNALRLTGWPDTWSNSRNHFWIHGGGLNASHGCVILPKNIRDKIRDAGGGVLHVFAG